MRCLSALAGVLICGGWTFASAQQDAASIVAPGEDAQLGATPLSLKRVLESVQMHHPVLQAEREAVAAAQGEAVAARGEFDTTVTVQARGALGYYDPRRLDVVVEQPTPLLGASVYGGYRITRGKVAPYYGEQNTLDRGELRAGIRLPLLTDRSIDARRAAVQTTKTIADAQNELLDEIRLDMQRDAAQAYFAWVAAGQRLKVLERLVALAHLRDEQIRSKVALGALPVIEQLDNARSLLERQRQLVGARRAFEKASLDLSLFLRDERGAPRVVGAHELPSETPEVPLAINDLGAAERGALATRPEIAAFGLMERAAGLERDLARNRTLPRLDAFAEASKDIGKQTSSLEPTLSPAVVEVGVSFSMPLWLRKARGKLRAAEAKLHAAQQKSRFVQDKVLTEVRDAWSQLQAASERIAVATHAVDLSERVATGERERFELGSSTVLFVNLREQTAADARMALIDALAELQSSAARFLTVSGQPLSTVGDG